MTVSRIVASDDCRGSQAGFSLIELMVALVVTGIVTGAMFGLLIGGRNAFRREPQLTERQQSIRMAMTRIQRDLEAAGLAAGPFTQVFTNLADGAGIPAPVGNTDILEFLAHTGQCPDVDLANPPFNGVNVNNPAVMPSCYLSQAPVLIEYDNGVTKPAWVHKIHGGGGKANIPPGQAKNFPQNQIGGKKDLECAEPLALGGGTCSVPICNPAAPPTGCPVRIKHLEVIRYQIGVDVDNVPSLWRSGVGGFDSNAVVDPGDATAAAAGWRLVARGIEDFQVRYFRPNPFPGGTWADTAGVVDPLGAQDITTLVQKVRVTLSARTTLATLSGATTVGASSAVRGQLTSVTSPRGALLAMSQFAPPGGVAPNMAWQ